MGCGASTGASYREDTKKPDEEEGKSADKLDQTTRIEGEERKRPEEEEERKSSTDDTAKAAKDENKSTLDEENVRSTQAEEQKRKKEEQKKKNIEEEQKGKLEEEEKNRQVEDQEKKRIEAEERKRIEAEEEKKRLQEEERRKSSEEEAKRSAEEEHVTELERREKEVLDFTPIQALGDLKVDVDVVVTGPGDGKRACTIIEVEIFGKLKVHYKGFKREFDEWLQKTSYRILGILRESSIEPVVEAAVAFHKTFAPYVTKADSMVEAVAKTCNDFKLAAIDGEDIVSSSESFANKVLSEHPDLGLEPVRHFYQATFDFIIAISGTKACWFSCHTEGVCSLFDAFRSAFCAAPKKDAFTTQLQSALLELKGIFKEDGLHGDENGPWFGFE